MGVEAGVESTVFRISTNVVKKKIIPLDASTEVKSTVSSQRSL